MLGLLRGVFLFRVIMVSSWSSLGVVSPKCQVRSIIICDTNIFVGTLGKGVFLSTYNDTSWTAVSTGLTDMNIFCLAVSGKNIFAGTWLGGVFLSTNNGTNWTSVNTGCQILQCTLSE